MPLSAASRLDVVSVNRAAADGAFAIAAAIRRGRSSLEEHGLTSMRLKTLNLALNELAFLAGVPRPGETVLARPSGGGDVYLPGKVSVVKMPPNTAVLLYEDEQTGLHKTARRTMIKADHLKRVQLLQAGLLQSSDDEQPTIGEEVWASTYRGYRASEVGELEVDENRTLLEKMKALQRQEYSGKVDAEDLTKFHMLQDTFNVPKVDEPLTRGRLMERFVPRGQDRYGVLFADGSLEKFLPQEDVTGEGSMFWMDGLFDQAQPGQVGLVATLRFVEMLCHHSLRYLPLRLRSESCVNVLDVCFIYFVVFTLTMEAPYPGLL